MGTGTDSERMRQKMDDKLSARGIAQMVAHCCRINKTPRDLVVPAMQEAIVQLGYDVETAERESLTVWREHWERSDIRDDEK